MTLRFQILRQSAEWHTRAINAGTGLSGETDRVRSVGGVADVFILLLVQCDYVIRTTGLHEERCQDDSTEGDAAHGIRRPCFIQGRFL